MAIPIFDSLRIPFFVSFCVLTGLFTFEPVLLAQDPKLDGNWKTDPFATAVYEINGTEGRNNPLRRKLVQPFRGEELFVRYRIRYDKSTLDSPPGEEGEFLVLWLDEAEGNTGATHTGGIPNIGIHVSGKQNRFMIRYASNRERFAAQVVGDQDFQVVARLWKMHNSVDGPFDQLDLWIDPKPDAEDNPDASVESPEAIKTVSWLGFSTGAKTEIEDRIFVWDVAVSSSWNGILEIPEAVSQNMNSTATSQRTVDFNEHVLPILTEKCFPCHSGTEAESRLDIHDEVLNLCSIGSAKDSQLFHEVSAGNMPPRDKPQLSQDEIEVIETWINEGLDWDEERLPPPRPETDHWSFQPIVRPVVPKIKRSDWVQTPIDAFIGARQEELGVKSAAPASGATLTRRMSLDMLGVPPNGSMLEVDEFLNDRAYAERWARHWLDVARWAESNGHQHNRFRPFAWRYRDWVIDAFSRDLPFDQFLLHQIAGDELPVKNSDDDPKLVATGFLAAARYSGNELDKRIQRNDILVDVVNTTASAFLGLTLECAQCHTHKFDPISLRDYYRLQAFFADAQPSNVSFATDAKAIEPLVRERWEIFDQTYERLVKVRRKRGDPTAELVIPKTVVARMSGTDRTRFDQLNQQINEFNQTWAFCSPQQSKQSRTMTPHEMRWPLPRRPRTVSNGVAMLLRGDVNSRGPIVQPGWPRVFGPTPEQPISRIHLAEWMTNKENPLVARVWVNRIWAWHFGRGLVATIGDFGQQGTRPTHPMLLDFLASELIDHAWSTNHIHRLILNSATYRQSSAYSKFNNDLDPGNTSYWRWTPRRLESEAIRDCILAASGQLDRTAGGPSDTETNSKRRSIYQRQHRQRFPIQQTLFDGETGNTSCSRRLVSTNALQPLWSLNSEFSQQAAAALAARSGTIDAAFKTCLGRQPSESERRPLQIHVDRHGLASACLVLLNSSEFLYIP